MNNKSEYLRFRNSLLRELGDADACFNLYLHLHNQLNENRDIHLDATTYFRMTLHSLSRTALAILTNVFEMRKTNEDCNKLSEEAIKKLKSTQTRTIHKFLSCLDSNHKNIFPKDDPEPLFMSDHEYIKKTVKNHQKLINEHLNSIQTLLYRRDKYFAHLDNEYVNNPDSLEEIKPFYISEFRSLMRLGIKILNESPGGKHTLHVPPIKGYTEGVDRLFFKVKEYNDKLAPSVEYTTKTEKSPKKEYQWDFEINQKT